ncbi:MULTISPECIES: isoprenyl transferase [Brevibacillus]|jgi:undecaprenyl diphosphate synthase|uniref:Isoprenyl transferase n=1 Tax=Brevibacillus parabrevis TaxID=54914 RepID=A0A4Y3PBS1_BREPA|nr:MULTISPECIES: isoprenyl transferase [Brevibacillus]TGV29074.1 isoprenyl transferase [Mesorhizobium sp. M00.F.Ca.ET.186.01.1.1]MBU8711379.1 isoprenyl transferase [Brevibacillus parabrevis]MDH6349993.1 undecaprenyl diphosphate synthase [Brevibacillus sp. 1238]MDR4999445.1 isoprenyl transferase [Brevibacillus parabrevis]MED1721688.1 isoprenyl transferase [Brevibacillus parabrevis]
MLEHLARKWSRKEKQTVPAELDRSGKIPQHVAVIMDGNGRWAKMRNLPRVAGHRAGMKTVKEVVKAADEIGVRYMTMYAFSTENWKRPRDEVDFLMKLPQEFLSTELDELIERDVRIRMLGSKDELPSHTLDALLEAEARTQNNQGLQLCFAMNYGGRDEIVKAVSVLASKVKAGELDPQDLDEEAISRYLYTSDIPDPDLLIRTSGEIRLSNFMLWQLAYTELWFTDVLWPDFTREHFYQAIVEYQGRARRYGAV